MTEIIPMEYNSKNQEYISTRHTIAQLASGKAFFEIIDLSAPFLISSALPTEDDYKRDKFEIKITAFNEKGENGKSKQTSHFLEKSELLVLIDQISRGFKGTPDKEYYKPILTSFKGSYDKKFPKWEAVSRVLTIKYADLRIGPAYTFEMVHSEGTRTGKGLISPTGNKEGSIRLTFTISLAGTAEQQSQALRVALLVKQYLQAREIGRQSLWARTLAGLEARGRAGDTGAQDALRQFRTSSWSPVIETSNDEESNGTTDEEV